MATGGMSLELATFGADSLVRERRWRKRGIAFASSSTYKGFHASIQEFSLPESSCQEPMVHLEAEHRRIEQLKQGVRETLCNGSDFTLIDNLQHLGISYHFEDEIDAILQRSYSSKHDVDDLFLSSLRFRLLRQGGYNVTQDIFHKFMDKQGNFKEHLRNDLLGMLSLHEASFLGARDEEVLSRAKVFSKQNLDATMRVVDPSQARDIGLAMAFPRHRRMERCETKSYIEMHVNEYGRSSDLLELATLDFNMVQRLYQREIGELVSWWRDLGLAKKLSFARDRPLECFLWTVGMFPETCYSRCRVEVAKTVAILLVTDDIYDIYGSLEELALFTEAIRRWDVDATKELPEYMKIGYMAIYNTTSEIGLTILDRHGINATPHLRKTWVDLCEAFLLEARCFRVGLVPTLEDYLSVAVTTAGTYMALVHAFFLIGKQVTKGSIDFVDSCPALFTNSGRILRLWDDLGTTKAEQLRGDDASSLSCYLKHNEKSSESDARNHVRHLIDNSWQELNKNSLASAPVPRCIIRASINLARTSQSIYQHGDDDGAPSIDENIEFLLTKPISHEYFVEPTVVNGRKRDC